MVAVGSVVVRVAAATKAAAKAAGSVVAARAAAARGEARAEEATEAAVHRKPHLPTLITSILLEVVDEMAVGRSPGAAVSGPFSSGRSSHDRHGASCHVRALARFDKEPTACQPGVSLPLVSLLLSRLSTRRMSAAGT